MGESVVPIAEGIAVVEGIASGDIIRVVGNDPQCYVVFSGLRLL